MGNRLKELTRSSESIGYYNIQYLVLDIAKSLLEVYGYNLNFGPFIMLICFV